MVALGSIKTLKDTKNQLLEQQKELVDILKTKHRDFYLWLKSKNIDPQSLGVFSVGLASAVSAYFATLDVNNHQHKTLTPHVRVIKVDELMDKDETQKAELVWERYGEVIKRNSKKYTVDSKLIFATIMLESGGNTYAVRYESQINDASYGLGQILYSTARGLGFEGRAEDLFDPEINIAYIAKYHARNNKMYGGLNFEQLTTAYNAGSPYSKAFPGHINKFNKWLKVAERFVS